MSEGILNPNKSFLNGKLIAVVGSKARMTEKQKAE